MQMDMNVSLTAVSLLWNASDLISKLHSKVALEPTGTDSGASTKPATSQAFEIDTVQFEELIRQLFGALQVRFTNDLGSVLSGQNNKWHGQAVQAVSVA